MIARRNIDEVEVIGCDQGMDWIALHDNGMIKLITESGDTIFLYYLQYKKEVIDFANMIENYYRKSSSKILPEDEFDRNEYLAFWNEWNRRMVNEKGICD